MFIAIRIALLSLLLCLPARGQEIQVGSAVACDTQEQVERFVAVFRGDAESAAKTVNAEARNPSACDMVAVAYIFGPEVATVRTDSRTFRIVRILVLGVVTPAGIMPAAFYSYIEVDERAA